MIRFLLTSFRAPFALALVAALGLLCSAVAMSELLGLSACPLCILQRMACLLLAVAALPGLIWATHSGARTLSAVLMLTSTAAGAFVAGYQVTLQRFIQDVQCSGQAAWWELFVDWAGEKAPLLFQSSGLCSEDGWVFLGLSLADYSLLGFFALMLLSAWALRRR